ATPASYLRFWVPDPDGSKTEFQRAYTMTEMDPDTGHFAVDVVLHEPSGPASKWARTAEPGDTAGYLLISDAAAIPAINGIIGVLPHDIPIEVYLEEHDENDLLIPIADHPRLRLHWVKRHDTMSLAAAIETRDWSDWYCWV
ncbi:SIP domain-containing protein, partial [Mycobacteriaceae bacterium Msp059]|nr:SIP domain-containing protein [Mycobacteriaceae bacterium Msp059]